MPFGSKYMLTVVYSLTSLLPPSTTIRQYQRKLLARTSSELGTIYCQVISFANSKRQTEVPEIATNLLAIRRKLRKSQAVRQNVGYEVGCYIQRACRFNLLHSLVLTPGKMACEAIFCHSGHPIVGLYVHSLLGTWLTDKNPKGRLQLRCHTSCPLSSTWIPLGQKHFCDERGLMMRISRATFLPSSVS